MHFLMQSSYVCFTISICELLYCVFTKYFSRITLKMSLEDLRIVVILMSVLFAF